MFHVYNFSIQAVSSLCYRIEFDLSFCFTLFTWHHNDPVISVLNAGKEYLKISIIFLSPIPKTYNILV